MTDIASAATGSEAPLALPPHIVLYDGVCVLCNKSMRMLMKLDRDERLRYAPLQGETAKALGIEWDEDAPDADATFRFVDATGPTPVIHERMDAVRAELAAIRRMPLLRALIAATPKPLANATYRWIAGNRYKWFGRYDACRLPSERERALFLD